MITTNRNEDQVESELQTLFNEHRKEVLAELKSSTSLCTPLSSHNHINGNDVISDVNNTSDHQRIFSSNKPRRFRPGLSRHLRNIARIYWDYRGASNSEVGCRISDNDGKSVDEVVNFHRLRWLGHVLRMPEHRLPRRARLTSVGDGWKKVRGDQTKMWHQCLKTITSNLSHVGRWRLLGWGPHDCRTQWL
ncbi:unnamed protein product [Schistosoma mattheei]|uniref:Uncharacterized protein n=1 Tax=Schistosoma mattheei TaxID=31246 RepID=A0A183Q2D4_9TREM|nr:unnamed protein product [Schistosoma mattheei]